MFSNMVRFGDGSFQNPFASWQENEKADLISRIVGLGLASGIDLNQKSIWELKALLQERGLLRR